MLRSDIYVCPVCGNVIHSTGSAVVSCCGIALPSLEAEEPADGDAEHGVNVEQIDYEYYVTAPQHPMTKTHHISFMAYCTGSRFELVKLYPEGTAEARFYMRGHSRIYWYCNHHGLFVKRV